MLNSELNNSRLETRNPTGSNGQLANDTANNTTHDNGDPTSTSDKITDFYVEPNGYKKIQISDWKI